jgi:hypothetical protein
LQVPHFAQKGLQRLFISAQPNKKQTQKQKLFLPLQKTHLTMKTSHLPTTNPINTIATLCATLLIAFSNNTLSARQRISIVDKPSTQSNSPHYITNRAPLAPESFIKLPVGDIQPAGWPMRYLELQRDGLTGGLGSISAWLDKTNNAWLGQGTQWGWEEVPYWLRGYGNMAYIMKDEAMLRETKYWIDAVFASRRPDGYFGPVNERGGKPELWANMIMLWCLQSYHEYSGDQRVIDLMLDYCRWQMALPDESFLEDYWENSRGGDNILSVYWLYNITGESFLLDLVHKIHRNTADWTRDSSLPNWHNVNIAQGFREPATYHMLTHDPAHLHASYNNHDLIRRTFGQVPGGMFGADENARMGYIDPRQGTETCGFVEQMASDEIMLRQTGDPAWAEHCENVAFNSLPAAFMPDFRSLRYITAPNHVVSDSKNHNPGIDNSGPFLAMNPFSSRCCQHNHSMGWPYFIENLVFATRDRGAAIAIYGACSAKVRVADGQEITITEDTRYPFEEQIRFTVNTDSRVAFPLYLRVPSWCNNAKLFINGQPADIEAVAGKYLLVEREWRNGDTITIDLPMRLTMRTWQVNQNSVSVDYGPLTLSLEIGEEHRRVESTTTAVWDSKWQKNADPSLWPSWELYPTTPWNYALELSSGTDPLAGITVERRPWPADNFPFTQAASPLVFNAKGRRIPSWTVDRHGLCGVLPNNDAHRADTVENIRLVPMGAARLRISAFPR